MVIEDHIDLDGKLSLTDQLISTITGIAPIIVASTLLVSNLNADMLDGYHASSFAQASNVYSKAESNNRYVGLGFDSIGYAETSYLPVSIDSQSRSKIVYSSNWTGMTPDGHNTGLLKVSDTSAFFGVQEFQTYGDSWFFRLRDFEGSGWDWGWYQVATRQYTDDTYYTKLDADNFFAPKIHTHSAADITSGIFPIGRIPTGNTSATVALGNHTHAVLTRGTGLLGSNYNGSSGTTWSVEFGTSLGTVAQGNDSRINNGQTAFLWGNHALAGYASGIHNHSANDITSGILNIARIPTGTTSSTVALGNHTHAILTRGTGLTGSNYNGGAGTTWAVLFGNIAGTVAEGNDSRIVNGQTAYSWGNHALAGYVTSAHSHSADDITSGTLNINRIPTGTTSTTVSLGNHSHAFSAITGKPTTLAGYGISDAYSITQSDSAYAPISHSHSFASLTGKPTTISGYGITDAFTESAADAKYALLAHNHAILTAGTGLSSTTYNGSTATTFSVNFGTSAGSVAQGNDSRIVNGQTAFSWGNHALSGYLTSSSLANYVQKWETWGSKFDQGAARPVGMVNNGVYILGSGVNQSVSTFHTSAGRAAGIVFGAYQAVETGNIASAGTFKSHGPGTDFNRRGGVFSFTSNGGHFIWSVSELYSGLAGENSDLTMVEAMRLNASGLTTTVDANFPNIYSKTDVNNLLTGYSTSGHTHSFSSLTAKPTTLVGYGITDVFSKTESDGRYALAVHNHAASQITSGVLDIARIPTGTSGTSVALGNHIHATLSAGTGLTGTAYTGAAVSTFSVNFGTASGTVAQGNDSRILNGQTAFTWGNHALQGYLKSSDVSGVYQPLDSDLTAIAGLSGTSGLLRKTAENTWSLDTNTYSLNTHTHAFSELTGKPTTISGYGITDVYTKTDGDLRYVLGSAGNFLQALGFAGADYNLLTGNSIRAHDGGVGSYTNGPTISASSSAYRTILTLEAHSSNFLTGTHKGQIVFNTIGQMAFRQQLNSVWGSWYNLVNESRSFSAGNGLTGGGDLSANRTLTLGTPSAITLSSSNSVTGTTHTHAFTPGGTTSQYIRGDGTLAAFPAIPAGTVTSIGMSVPTGFAVTPTSITTSGTFNLTFSSGYSLPTTTKQTEWDTAFSWGNHGSQGYAKLPIRAIDWLTTGTVEAGVFKLNTSSTNGPAGGAAYHGIWIPHNTGGTYGTNLVFRNNAAFILSLENGVWNSWNQIITQSYLTSRTFTINGTAYNLGTNQTINVGDVNSFGAKTDGALTVWNNSGQLISSNINVNGNTYTLGGANSNSKTIKFNYGSNEVGFQITNWSAVGSIGPHAALFTGNNGSGDGYGRLALVSRPTDDSNGRIDFRVGSDRKIAMWVNFNGDVVTPYRFISSITTGTSPFQVSSNTLVSNLNADLLDGLHATDFLQVASPNAYVYRTNWGGMDANTMYTNSGWWVNHESSPSGSNFPINQAGRLSFIRNSSLSNSGDQEFIVTGGSTINRGRKFWRSVHGGTFTAWQEYLSAEKAALTYVTTITADFKYGVRAEDNIWTGQSNIFAPDAFVGLHGAINSISIFRRTGEDGGTSIRGIDKDGIEAWRLKNNDAETPKTNIQLSLENGQISVPGGDSNLWNEAYNVVQNLTANVAPPRFRPAGVVYIPKNQNFAQDLNVAELLISNDNLADLKILHIDNFYADKGISTLNSHTNADLMVHISGTINMSIPENYNPIEVVVENTTNGRQTHVPVNIATIEYTNVIPAWVTKIGITYYVPTHESTIHFEATRDVESRILALSGPHPNGLDHDSQPWNSMVWNPGTSEWVSSGYTELARYNPTTSQMGTGGLQPDENYVLEFREPTNPLIIYQRPFKTPDENVTSPQSILGGSGSLPACTVGPDLLTISNITQTGLNFQFHGEGVTHIKWRIKSGGSVVREGNAYPSSSVVSISYDLLQPGNYTLEIEGGNCSSPVDSDSFTIAGGQTTGFYLQLFRDGVQVNSQWNGGSMPVPTNHFTVKFIKPASPNYGAITYFWEVKINNTWQPAHFFLNHSGTTGWVSGGFLSSAAGDRFLVPDMIDNTTPRSIYIGTTTDSPSMNPKRLVTDPAEFRLVVEVRSGNTSSPITETKYYNLQLTTSGGGIPVEAGYNEQVITSPNEDWKATFSTGRKTQWSINNNGEITDNYPDNYNGGTRRLMVDGIWQNVHYMVNMHWYPNIINLKLPEGNYSITKLYAPEDITEGMIDANHSAIEARLTQDADHLTEIKIEQVVTGAGIE